MIRLGIPYNQNEVNPPHLGLGHAANVAVRAGLNRHRAWGVMTGGVGQALVWELIAVLFVRCPAAINQPLWVNSLCSGT